MNNAAPVVLIAEADPKTRAVLADLLYAEGFRPLVAADGASATRFLDTATPALIVADLRLPRFSGVQLRNHCRSDARVAHVPFILTTNLPARNVEHLVEEFDVVLHKPYPVETLFGHVFRLSGRALRGRTGSRSSSVEAVRSERV